MYLAYQYQMNRLNNEVENIYREVVIELLVLQQACIQKKSDNELEVLPACSFRSYACDLPNVHTI